MGERKIAYLQMIMEPISRMSTTTAIYKGFTATIVSGISALSYQGISKRVLLLSFVPVLVFALLDIYYLSLERRFRYLYKLVQSDKKNPDFSMDIKFKKEELKMAKARCVDCVKSPSFYLFYPIMIVIVVIVFVMDVGGVI